MSSQSFSEVRSLSDETLLKETQNLRTQENAVTLKLLHYIREVERRRLFLTKGYSSLFEFCTKSLHYSDGAAYRRIQAMKLLQGLSEEDRPQVEKQIENGELNLSHLSAIQSFVRSEEKETENRISPEQKADLVNQVKDKSKREVDALLAKQSSRKDPPPPLLNLEPLEYSNSSSRADAYPTVLEKFLNSRPKFPL